MATQSTNQTLAEKPGLYLNSRGIDFWCFLTDLFSNLIPDSKEERDALLTHDAIFRFSSAFTSEHVDEHNNYQFYELLGDSTANNCLVKYFYNRFSQLRNKDGVKVVARLKINYGSKQSFYRIADDLGFWPYISATIDDRQRRRKGLLEDVFEAFVGVIEQILDEKFGIGRGYARVYQIIAKIFDKIDISLKYEDLYDAKTRLKEYFDSSANPSKIVYSETRDELITTSIVTINGTEMGRGSASLKPNAQQNAAQQALAKIPDLYIPPIYEQFAQGMKPRNQKVTVSDIQKEAELGIDHSYSTKGRMKYRQKYSSTLLAKYCRQKNISGIRACLRLGATIDLPDSNGLYPTDLLLIGDMKMVAKIIDILFEHKGKKLLITSEVMGQANPWLSESLAKKIEQTCQVVENSVLSANDE